MCYYDGFQECESSLRHKTELIAKLEAKTFSMTDTIQRMDEKYALFYFLNEHSSPCYYFIVHCSLSILFLNNNDI